MTTGCTLEPDRSPDLLGLHGVSPIIVGDGTPHPSIHYATQDADITVTTAPYQTLLPVKSYLLVRVIRVLFLGFQWKRAKFDLKLNYLDTNKNFEAALYPTLKAKRFTVTALAVVSHASKFRVTVQLPGG